MLQHGKVSVKVKKTALYGVLIAVAFVLSYIESMFPFTYMMGGIKIGLANVVVVTAMYIMGGKDAFIINIVRIMLSSLTFSGMSTLIYSMAGGITSFIVMILAKKSKAFSVMGVSTLGAVTHNFSQIIVAIILLHTKQLIYYFLVLFVVGVISGLANGYLGGLIISRIHGEKNNGL